MEKTRQPFTSLEKSLLTNLVENHPIVSDRKTDGTRLAKKQQAWERITQEFNKSPLILQKVTTKQLTRLWNNMKARARDAKTIENQRHYTGGGAAVPDMDPLDARVLSVDKGILTPVDIDIDGDVQSIIKADIGTPLQNSTLMEVEELEEAIAGPSSCSADPAYHVAAEYAEAEEVIVIEADASDGVGWKVLADEENVTENCNEINISAAIADCRRIPRKKVTDNDLNQLKKKLLEEELKLSIKKQKLVEIEISHKKRMNDLEYKLKLKELDMVTK